MQQTYNFGETFRTGVGNDAIMSDGTASLIEGYVTLSALAPVFLLFAVIFLLVIILMLVSISSKLSRVSEQLETVNISLLRGPLSREDFDRLTARQREDDVRIQAVSSITALVLLGIVIGAFIVLCGLLFEMQSVWRSYWIAIGALFIVLSIVVAIVKAFSQRKVEDSKQGDSTGQ